MTSLCDAVTATLTLMSYLTTQTTQKSRKTARVFFLLRRYHIRLDSIFYYAPDFSVEEHNIKELFVSRTRTSVVSDISHTYYFAAAMTGDEKNRMFLEIPYHKCSLCDNLSSAFTCNGCQRSFCVRHSTEHRNQLTGTVNELFQRNKTMQDVNNETLENQRKYVTEEIYHWKQQSIAKIEQTATKALDDVNELFSVDKNSQLNQLSEYHKDVAVRLQEAAAMKNFHERHVEYWRQFLDDLQQNFNQLRKKMIRIEYHAMPSVSKICIRESSPKFHFTQWSSYQRNGPPVTDIRRSVQDFDL